MKALHRLIVTSNAYRMQSSSGSAEDSNLAIDPENHYLWRMNPRRMEAEVVRDSVLHVAGQLDASMGGPEIDHEAGLTSRRRSLYFRHALEKQMTFLKVFDAAGVNECYRRSESVIPQQALALANSKLALAQARLLAASLSKAVQPQADAAFVIAAFEQVLSRRPSDQERQECLAFLESQAKLFGNPERLTAAGRGAAPDVQPDGQPHLRARENLVHVLLNHHDFVTIR